ncbi:MAG TPA: beta-N-acetylhexosaminidase [Streptosporangiaceae bacterium]
MSDRLATLLPFPRLVRQQSGYFPLGAATQVLAGPHAIKEADAVRRVLANANANANGNAYGNGNANDILVDVDASLPPEGYRLEIGPDHVRVKAADPAGAFYAAQTIRQLLPDEAWRAAPIDQSAPTTIPCAEIEDAPSLKWRGAHLDLARHFFPKPVVLRFIDLLAQHKLNRLHLHLTDDQGWRIESPSHPKLHEIGSHRPYSQLTRDPRTYDNQPHGGYYTLADLAEIDAYAAHRMITVVPELEVPGHARALLAALPELAAAPGTRELTVATDWGIFPQIMSPLPGTLDVLAGLFGELLGAIPAKYVHIGGDECVLTDWEADPRIRDYQRDLRLPSPVALHAYFLRQVADMLATSFGARSMVWDEGFTSAMSGTGLRPDTVVMAWHGMDVARRAAEAGYDVVASPTVPTYFDYAQAKDDREPASIGGLVRTEDVAAFSPVPRDWSPDIQARLIGTQFQVWTEYISDPRMLDYMTFPRACAFADVAWAGKPVLWATLCDRLDAHLGRLAAAGVEYRPLSGPHPWQQRNPV